MPALSKRALISFDWALKKQLRKKSNFGILEGFLSVLFGKKIIINHILESESNKDNFKSKTNKVDIVCQNDQGEFILIELQYYAEIDFLQRMLFGASKLITDHLEEGNPYAQIKKVYSINIVYFDLGTGTDYIYYGKTAFYGLNNHDELKLNATQQNKMQKEEIHQIFPEIPSIP